MAKITHLPLPPLELLQELFEISETSPSGLRWKTSRTRSVKPGQVAGGRHIKGYWHVGITTDTTKRYKAHRIVYFLQTKQDPGNLQVDHIFGISDPLSLRLATNEENGANRKPNKHHAGKKCSSEFKGVTWHKQRQKWMAQLVCQGKLIHLGRFTDEIEAAKAYNNAALKYFGEFARLNKL